MEWERRELISYLILELCDSLEAFPLQLAGDIQSLDAAFGHIRAACGSWLTEGAEEVCFWHSDAANDARTGIPAGVMRSKSSPV